MVTKRFQYNRDVIVPYHKPHSPKFSIFTGHSEFSSFFNPSSPRFKTFINLQKLVSEASRLLDYGSQTPLYGKSQLKKLAVGSKFLKLDTKNMKIFENFGKAEFMNIIEFYFVTVIKWMMLFDEFHKLDRSDQMTLLYSVWHVWMKFHKCCTTATFKKLNLKTCPDQHVLRNTVMDRKKAKMDTEWMSDYPLEYVSVYMKSQNIHEIDITESILKLEPTDVELTFLFAQSCFEYAGKRFQGEILKITDHFQHILTNDLHSYYTEEQNNPRYLHRLAELMKVNNLIQRSKWESRPQRELNRVFNVLKIGFSHPEMFEDSQFY